MSFDRRFRWQLLKRVASIATVLLSAESVAAQTVLGVLPTQVDASIAGEVPPVFGDYALAIARASTTARVVGPVELAALLDLDPRTGAIDCLEPACLADAGEAVGVDTLLVIRVGSRSSAEKERWLARAWLVDVRARTAGAFHSEAIEGDVLALLGAVPRLLAPLFPGAPPVRIAAGATEPDDSHGRAARWVGLSLIAGGSLVWTIGAILTTVVIIDCDDERCAFDADGGSGGLFIAGLLSYATGLGAVGLGAKVRADGRAQRVLANPDATGTPSSYWLGWTLASIAVVTPIVGTAGYSAGNSVLPSTAMAVSWLAASLSTAVFMAGGFGMSSVELPLAAELEPLVTFVPTGPGDAVPVGGVAMRF